MILAAFALSSPLATADTLYYEGWGYWNTPSHWWTDASGTPAGRIPTADTDVIVSGVGLSDNSTQINTTGIDTIKSLTFDGTQTFSNVQNIWFHDGFTISGDFYYATSGTGNMLAFVGADREFNVGGSFTVDASANSGRSWVAFYRQTTTDSRIGTVNIKNGLEIIGGTGNVAVTTCEARQLGGFHQDKRHLRQQLHLRRTRWYGENHHRRDFLWRHGDAHRHTEHDFYKLH